MGFWAKDGSYQRDDSDIQAMEAMNETQGQRFDRLDRAVIDSNPLFTEREREKREAEYQKDVDKKIEWYQGNREYREQQKQIKVEKKQDELRREAFENAKRRFNSLNPIKKLWLKLTNNGIDSYSRLSSVETLDSLYGGKLR